MVFNTRVALVGSVLAAAANAVPHYADYGSASNTTTGGGGGVVYTTEVVTSLTTYCPYATTLTYGEKTYTVTEPTTLTITDCPCTVSKPVYTHQTYAPPAASSSAAVETCAEECYDAYNECRGKPNANMATCAAEYASCLGYNPFGDDGSLKTPTACSSQPAYTHPPVVYTTEVVTALTTYCPEATTLTYNNFTYPVTEPGTVTITNCPCTVSKPLTTYPVPTQSAAATCPEECATAYDSCRSAANANMATCAAEYAGCLGYSPFGPDGSLITPTACSAGATGVKTTYPAGSATYSVPAGSATATTPAVVHGSGAERVAPAALLLVLGAVALF